MERSSVPLYPPPVPVTVSDSGSLIASTKVRGLVQHIDKVFAENFKGDGFQLILPLFAISSEDEWSGGDSNCSSHLRNVERRFGRQFAPYVSSEDDFFSDDIETDQAEIELKRNANRNYQHDVISDKRISEPFLCQQLTIPKLGGAATDSALCLSILNHNDNSQSDNVQGDGAVRKSTLSKLLNKPTRQSDRVSKPNVKYVQTNKDGKQLWIVEKFLSHCIVKGVIWLKTQWRDPGTMIISKEITEQTLQDMLVQVPQVVSEYFASLPCSPSNDFGFPDKPILSIHLQNKKVVFVRDSYVKLVDVMNHRPDLLANFFRDNNGCPTPVTSDAKQDDFSLIHNRLMHKTYTCW